MFKSLLSTWERVRARLEILDRTEPYTWEEFAPQLQDPARYMRDNLRYVTEFHKFSAQEDLVAELTNMAAATNGTSSVFVKLNNDGERAGLVQIFIKSPGFGVLEWQSKPNGGVYRPYTFGDLQSLSVYSKVNDLVLAALEVLAENPQQEPVVARTRAAYEGDIKLFSSKPKDHKLSKG